MGGREGNCAMIPGLDNPFTIIWERSSRVCTNLASLHFLLFSTYLFCFNFDPNRGFPGLFYNGTGTFLFFSSA